ncbi:MAG: class I SAM-dependent methyltransferase [Opitutae bacterium]|nr:class I SAM-dependent methyltransferase [Opitutae bacterium]
MAEKNVAFNEDYWNAFYQKFQRHTPSQFCVSIVTEIDEGATIVELGSGNGRDSHYLASQGYITVALDLSHEAIKRCKEHAEKHDVLHSHFYQGDITSADDIAALVEKAREKSAGQRVVFYSRFVMHSIDQEQESSFITALSDSMCTGEMVYFEFRSKEDETLEKHYGGHYRRYIDTASFTRALESRGLLTRYSITGQGMAKFKDEDPFVSRVIASKK